MEDAESNVVEFNGFTTLDIDPKRMLQNIIDGTDYSKVVVMGYDEDTDSWMCHSSTASKETIVYAAEIMKLATIAAGSMDDD